MLGYIRRLTVFALALGAAAPASAQFVIGPNSGDTGWMLTASALALLLVLPGLALFHAGLARAGNLLSTAMHVFAIVAGVSLLWAMIGYSLVFAPGGPYLGGAANLMLGNLAELREGTTVPESAFALFQMGFAVLAPALVAGAFAGRARFGWVVGFALLWMLICHVPLARWIWGDGWLAELGALDFAGGLVVHAAAGISALVAARILGPRYGFGTERAAPGAPALTLAGAGLLWVGWFGLTGGAAFAAADAAASAILNTHLAACAAALTWIAAEKLRRKRTTSIGLATGAIAGLVAVSAGAGYVGPLGAMLVGSAGAIVSFAALRFIKRWLKIDDTLDIFAVHGASGIAGALLLPLLILPGLGGPGYAGDMSATALFVAQLVAIAAVALWSVLATFVAAYMAAVIVPMRATEEAERDGLDLSEHGERA